MRMQARKQKDILRRSEDSSIGLGISECLNFRAFMTTLPKTLGDGSGNLQLGLVKVQSRPLMKNE